MTRLLATLALAITLHVTRSDLFRDLCAFASLAAFLAAFFVWLPTI